MCASVLFVMCEIKPSECHVLFVISIGTILWSGATTCVSMVSFICWFTIEFVQSIEISPMGITYSA